MSDIEKHDFNVFPSLPPIRIFTEDDVAKRNGIASRRNTLYEKSLRKQHF